jgi:hypothetical protein
VVRPRHVRATTTGPVSGRVAPDQGTGLHPGATDRGSDGAVDAAGKPGGGLRARGVGGR